VKVFDLGKVPPDFFDREKCMARNAMVVKYIGALIPDDYNDLEATADQIARCFWLDLRVRSLVFNYPERFPSIEDAYRAVIDGLNGNRWGEQPA